MAAAPQLSPRSSFVQGITSFQGKVRDAEAVTSFIKDEVFKARFSTTLDELQQQLDRIAAILREQGEFVIPIFGVYSVATEEMINTKIQAMKQAHVPKQDEQLAMLIFKSFLETLSPMTVPFKPAPAPVVPRNISPEQQTFLKTLFEVTLNKVQAAAEIHPECFISYAWGNRENQQKVHQMALDLKKAGIRILLDIWEIKPGEDVIRYAGKIQTCHYVLVMGSPELVRKFEKRTGNVLSIELESISVKYKHNRESIIPILVAGEGEEVFPYFLGGGQNLNYMDIRSEETYYRRILTVLQKLYEHSTNLPQIKTICEEYNTNEKSVKDNTYPPNQRDQRLKELEDERKAKEQRTIESIDKALAGRKK